MPNWCSNSVTIAGSLEEVTKTVQSISVGDASETGQRWLRFEALLPIPEAEASSTGWYEWCIANWGTKWDVSDDEGDIHTYYDDCSELASATCSFQTAWGPPIAFFDTLSLIDPGVTIRLEFDEPGMDFWGEIVFEGGKVIEQREGPSLQGLDFAEEFAEDENGDTLTTHWVGDKCAASHVLLETSADSGRSWKMYLSCGAEDNTGTFCSDFAGHEGTHQTRCVACDVDWRSPACSCVRRPFIA